MAYAQTLTTQAMLAYEAALGAPSPDWRAVAELFRAAVRGRKRAPRSPAAPKPTAPEIADYNVDRIKLKCRSPRIAVRFVDGEAVFTTDALTLKGARLPRRDVARIVDAG